MKNGVVKVKQQVNQIADFDSFTIMGDPGCDGLGAEIMATFAKGLTATRSDFAVILGDIVAISEEVLYQRISEFINMIAPYPTYLVCGNHDTDYYQKYFGLKDYLLVNDRILFVVLDNSTRKFEEATLDFLQKSLKDYARDNIILMFHIPPPTGMTFNTVTAEEWEKVASVYRPYKEKIKYLLSGHVHTYFEDMVDGIRMIVSAGAGARLENINKPVDKMKAFHHVLRFFFDAAGVLKFEHITLDGKLYKKELSDRSLRKILQEAFQDECEAYVKYKLFAQDALEKGLGGTAKLLRAIAESEFYQARNHFNNLNYLNTVLNNLEDCQNNEDREIRQKYPGYLSLAEKKKHGLAKYTFFEALEAERVHKGLFEEAVKAAKSGKDIELAQYYTCSSCGFSVRGTELPTNCPICGAPIDKIFEVH
ncbi:MAG: metallophosphoesterase [Candidatus Omnitrophota bacterium]|nr:metallophosphoesterase [Candidatus Omnitrophota bacterium]